MDEKIYHLNSYGTDYEIRLHCHRYEIDKSLAVIMDCRDPELGYWEPYADLTVFIERLGQRNLACVDANNLGEHIIEWCEENNIAFFTGRSIPSGYCSYPVMEFTYEFLKTHPIEY